MKQLDPWGPILGVLFEDGSSDFVLTTLAKAGIPTHFELTNEEAYSHNTRKRAYLKRMGPIYAAFDECTRHRVAENVARQLSKSEATTRQLGQALADVGWGLQQGRLLPLGQKAEETVTERATPNLTEEQKELLRQIVGAYARGSRAPFIFTGPTSTSGPTLIYGGSQPNIEVDGDESDLQRLAKEQLLDLTRNSQGLLRGKPTALGINMVKAVGPGKEEDASGLTKSSPAGLMPIHPTNGLLETGGGSPQPIEVFVSYSHRDEVLHDELAKHLRPLEREGVIQRWHDRRLTAGTEFGDEIDVLLNRAGIILLLVSPDFIASEYCWSKEMKRAMERHEAGEARVVPVILRPVDWHNTPFGKLLALPKDGKAVTSWTDRDTALLDVAKGIRAVASEVRDIAQTASARAAEVRRAGQPARHNSPAPQPGKGVDNANPHCDIDPYTLTLHDLFMRDFIGQKVGATWQIGEPRDIPGSMIKWWVVIDLQARSRFLEFYMTLAKDTYNMCRIIAESYMQALQYPETIGVMRQGPAVGESSGHSSDESVFTGAVFVYYEGHLSDKQVVELTTLFASKHLRVSFRGPAYLANRKAAVMPAPVQIRSSEPK